MVKSNKNESHKSHRHLFVDGHKKKRGTLDERERELETKRIILKFVNVNIISLAPRGDVKI